MIEPKRKRGRPPGTKKNKGGLTGPRPLPLMAPTNPALAEIPSVKSNKWADRITGEVKRARIYEIAQLLSAGRWIRGKTENEYTKKWNVSLATVRDYAAEASRLLAMTTDDINELERACRLRLRQIGEQDGTDRVQAIQTILKNIGRLNEKTELTLVQTPDEKLVAQAVRHAMADPKMRQLIRDELERWGELELLTPQTRGLLEPATVEVTVLSQGPLTAPGEIDPSDDDLT